MVAAAKLKFKMMVELKANLFLIHIDINLINIYKIYIVWKWWMRRQNKHADAD
jgi:hypothetical protein